MSDRHVKDPLEYLYEELPPDEMEEARTHLAECAQCRRELKEIRDAVKLYRRAVPPAAPAGLAARTAAMALACRKTARSDAAEYIPDAESGPGPAETDRLPETDSPFDSDREFEREKGRIIGEAGGWRARLFHPAWTVAASVLFVCAVLIHFSPRKPPSFPPSQAPVPERAAARPQSAGRQQKMARQTAARPDPTMDAKQDAAEFSPRSPILVEADALNAAPEPERNGEPGFAGVAEQQEAATPETPAPPPSPAPMPAPMAAPIRSMPMETEGGTITEGAAGAESPALFDAARPAMPTPDAFAMPEAWPTASRSAETAASPVVIEMAPPGEPPRLVARPHPVDDARSALNLSFLAGLQMGEKDFEGARRTIELIRKRDIDEADRLARVLVDMLLAESESMAAPGESARDGADDETGGMDESEDKSDRAASAGREAREAPPTETPETTLELPEERQSPAEPDKAGRTVPERSGSDDDTTGKTGKTPAASLRPPAPAVEPPLREAEPPAGPDENAAPVESGETGKTGESEIRRSDDPAPAMETSFPETPADAAEPHPLHIAIEIGPVYADEPVREPEFPDSAATGEPDSGVFAGPVFDGPPPRLRESEPGAGSSRGGTAKHGERNRFTTDPYWRER